MDKPETTTPPLIDAAALKADLNKLCINNASPAEQPNMDCLTRLKQAVEAARLEARRRLEAGGSGRACAEGLSDFQDDLTDAIFELVIMDETVCPTPEDRQAAEDVAVVATGGYGRGLLAPGSDIDLLFLLPDRHGPLGERIAEAMLYKLWDLGFKVGHATRTIKQSLQLAQADTTIRTSLLDARLIRGNRALFDTMQSRFYAEVVKTTARQFVDAKMSERDERHQRSGDARYRVEPNIKDGKGGLRDLHTLHWLSKIIYGEDVGAKTVADGIFTDEEAATFQRCEDFLWTIRCHLHFLTGRAEERISFDVQPRMSELLGYKRLGGLRGVERFMKHYFLVAKDVGDLTSILCAALEMQQLKSSPMGLAKMLDPTSWKKRREVRLRTEFRIENDRINLAAPDAFERDPLNILRLFSQSAKTGAFLHPDAIRQLRHSLGLIDATVRNDPEANRIFLDLLTETKDPATILRRMSDAGVLARFIPAFRKVVGMMQFNMYHHFTVDEHLIRTVQMLRGIETGDAIEELPLSSEIIKLVEKDSRLVLFVAAFLHDIGKGRKEDHSVVGARIARDLCPRLGLTTKQTDRVVWLVEHHLLMSNIAQTRDLSDPKTIKDFAEVVQSRARLQQLLLLTVADIRAVGPGVWNGWKGQLLRTLYHAAIPHLAGGYAPDTLPTRVAKARTELCTALADEGWTPKQTKAVTSRFYDDYWLKFDTATQIEHAKLIARAGKENTKLALDHTTDEFTEMTELTIFAPNHPRLLSLFAGACAVVGGNIVAAQITTTRDGFALDTFRIKREFATDEDEARRARGIEDKIKRLLSGEGRLQKLLDNRRPAEHRVEAFAVEPEVTVNNKLSDKLTVIEVAGRDRPGLLHDLTTALSDLNLDISSAHITTWGEKAVDVFYVTDLVGKKLHGEDRRQRIVETLEEILTIEDEPAIA
ncbi:MAG: [protein-PII] uridylyltransferase [Pseudomonadota bacterium]